MIQITQEEYFKLRKEIKDVYVKICSQRKKGAGSKSYYCEETKAVKEALDRIRKAV